MKRRRIMIAVTGSRALLEGVARFVRPGLPWVFELAPLSEKVLASLQTDPPDGVLAYLGNDSSMEIVKLLKTCVVNISGAVPKSHVPRVCVDSVAAGRLAAEHFLQRGFRHFAYVGYTIPAFSNERLDGFRQRLAEAGLGCDAFLAEVVLSYETRQRTGELDQAMREWLLALPPATALFAANDSLAWWVTEIAHVADVAIPEQLAVLGMDDAEFSTLSWPQLSTVVTPFEMIGYEAAKLLHQLVEGEVASAPAPDIRVMPTEIITRQSTDVLATPDAALALALRYIREHADDAGLRVEHVAAAAAINRRSLERRFQQLLQRSPLDEIRRARVERAKHLLKRPELSIEQIAESCGFSSRKWFSMAFKADTGMTPPEFRQSVAAMGGPRLSPLDRTR